MGDERPNQHLDFYALTMLASAARSPLAPSRFNEQERSAWEEHIASCAECRELVEQQQILFSMSAIEKTRVNSHAASACLSEQDCMEVAAGLRSPTVTQRQLEHVLHCERCAGVFRRVAEQFAAGPTAEESEVLGRLPSNEARWRAALAAKMQAVCSRKEPGPILKMHRSRAVLLQLAAITTFVLVLAWAGYSYLLKRPASAVAHLLGQAYSERRNTDLRMPGAQYARVEALRGADSSAMGQPDSLLKAELLIKKEVAKSPDDPFWLDVQGRAELMNDNYGAALSALERAHRYAPEDSVIIRDLASAYFLRAEELKRLEDYGRAADLLGQTLSKNPQDELALFNRAVVSERMFLYEQAVQDWHRYLELDAHSPWADEARKRMADVEQKIRRQRDRSSRPLLGPSPFLAKLEDPQALAAEIEPRIERYFELALREWVPGAFLASQGNPSTERRALEGLAKILVLNHGDYWLKDFLGNLKANPTSQSSLRSHTSFFRYDDAADYEHARRSALDAALSFGRSGNLPGELLMEFEASYTDQLARQAEHCLREARVRDAPQVRRRYPWLFAQFSLESAACSGSNDEQARRFSAEALSSAEEHHYPSLELRATTFWVGLCQSVGDTSSAWKYASQGLARYWDGDYPPVRGYSFYASLDLVAEDTQQWFLDTQILEEASGYIRSDPDFEMRGIEAYRLANAQSMIGDLSSADLEFRQTRDLFEQAQAGVRRANLELEAEIGFAKLDLARSRPEAAIHRLLPLKDRAVQLTDTDLAFDYYESLGLAYFAARQGQEAREYLGKAVALAEQSLAENQSERDRLIRCRKANPVYRAMTELALDVPPGESLAQWEWFKGASVRGRDAVGLHKQPPKLPFRPPPDTALVSYAFLPAGVYVWTLTHDGVSLQKLDVQAAEIQQQAYRFADHCSRPDSSAPALAEEGRALYRELVAPFETSLARYSHLIVEPDQSLWLIPFGALVEADGTYFGEHHPLSISPGLDYLTISPAWHGISRESAIVVAGNPRTEGRKPLPDAEDEAKGIASKFRYSKLLLEADARYPRIASELGDAQVFHFSGHAAASPGGLGLLFGDSARMDARTVHAGEFAGLQLVVFSACSSANGGEPVFDDRDSLARLLVGAGVPELVASRWAVNSRSTALLMDEFYNQLLAGKPVSSALSEATRRLRADNEFRHPFYWASFSVFGRG